MKSKGMSKGGKMPMVKDPKTGKKVPAFAVDGKGKMRKGGMMKKGYAKGGSTAKMSPKAMGSALKKFMDEGGFDSFKPAEISPMLKELKNLQSLRKKRMGGMMKKKGMKRGGAMMMKKKGMKKVESCAAQALPQRARSSQGRVNKCQRLVENMHMGSVIKQGLDTSYLTLFLK